MIGDRRQKTQTALCVLMYATGKASFNKLAQWLNHSRPLIYREIAEAMKTYPAPKSLTIFMTWNAMKCGIFWGQKKLGSGRPWIVADIDLST